MTDHALPILLGGRTAPRRRGKIAHAVFVWLPVVVMLLVIARESTAAFGSNNTSPILRAVYQALFGRVSNAAWEVAHHHIRKTGHFLGYGTLGVTWLRAFLLNWLATFRHRAAGVWRRWSLQIAISCTALVASLDEVHQSYIPDRTGLVMDVLLDTSGAVILCTSFVLFWIRQRNRQAAFRAA